MLRSDDSNANPILARQPSGWVPTLCFTGVCLTFIFIAFFAAPNMTFAQQKIMNFVFAITAGFATLFLGGTTFLEVTGRIGPLKLLFSATAGIAVFALCLLNPLFR